MIFPVIWQLTADFILIKQLIADISSHLQLIFPDITVDIQYFFEVYHQKHNIYSNVVVES